MKEIIQEYFNSNFDKNSKIIIFPKLDKELLGNVLIVEDYLNLEVLNVEKVKQIEEIIIKNCPKLANIKYSQKEERIIVIQEPKKDFCWGCVINAFSLVSITILAVYVIKLVKTIKCLKNMVKILKRKK